MFRRKSSQSAEQAPAGAASPVDAGADPEESSVPAAQEGPFDVDDLHDDLDRIDVGALLIAPAPGREVRLQVVEKTGEVASVLVVGEDGALELQAFAAPRNGDLWSEVRPQIAADVGRRGGRAAERVGRFGTELLCQVPVKRPDGEDAVQPSRVIGINGPRWMLRASLLGRPAVEPDAAGEWEEILAQVAVRRGTQAMPVGRPLPCKVPDDARRRT